MVNPEDPATGVLRDWTLYIGASYKSLQELKIDYMDTDSFTDYARVLDDLNIAMININQIKRFTINWDPYFDISVFKLAETRINELKKLKVVIGAQGEDMGEIQQMFQSLASTQSTMHTLNALETVFYDMPDPVAASIRLIDYCNHLRYLTHLRICVFKSQYLPTEQQLFELIYVDILNKLLALENLVFENLVLFEEGSQQDRLLSERLVGANIASSQLKSLSFSFETVNRNIPMEKCNLLLQFTLKS